jgi:hypothetical protein
MDGLLKKFQNITILVMCIAVVLLLAYDVFVALHAGTNATISWMIWTLSHEYPIIPFSVGFLCGHLFFTQTDQLSH